jgi:hypothetical protein
MHLKITTTMQIIIIWIIKYFSLKCIPCRFYIWKVAKTKSLSHVLKKEYPNYAHEQVNTQASFQSSSHSWSNQKNSHKFETQMCGGLFHGFLYNGHKHNTKQIWSQTFSGPKSSFISHWKPFFILQVMHPISQD